MKRTFLVLLGCVILASPSVILAQQSHQLLIHGAMTECYTGRITQDRASRVGHFEKGQAMGEQAVALDDRSADAHFALFCNLGELMRINRGVEHHIDHGLPPRDERARPNTGTRA